MPELPISDGAGSLVPFAGEIVYGTMLYPRDESGRKRALTLDIAERALRAEHDLVLVPRQFLGDLLDLPERKRLADEVGQLTRNALFSTRVLQYIITLNHYSPQHASVLKGVEIAAHYGSKRPDLIPASPSHIKGQWAHFKPVAHLWCAMMVAKTESPGFGFWGIQDAQLLHFLATAEWYRRQGESIKARAQSEPALNPSESWTVPADLPLPSVAVELGAPSAETLEVLKRYRAPKKI